MSTQAAVNSLFIDIDKERSFFLPGNVPSSKNSKEIQMRFARADENTSWTCNIRGVQRRVYPFIGNRKLVKDYANSILETLIKEQPRFLSLIGEERPVKLEILFVRKTRATFDFHNMVQAITDCLSGHYYKKVKNIPMNRVQWIDDDDVKNLLVYPPRQKPYYLVDKTNPGVWITVL